MPRLPFRTPWISAVVFFLLGVGITLGISAGLRRLPWFENRVLGVMSNVTPETVIGAINAERAEKGLEPLRINDQLSQAARAKADDMAEQAYWSHRSPTGKQAWDFIHDTKYTYRIAGENLARDFTDVKELVSAWLNSPRHRENLLNQQFQEAGVAVIPGVFGEKNTTLVVMLFAQPALAGVDSTIERSQISAPAIFREGADLRWLEIIFLAGIAGSVVALAFARPAQKR